MTDITTKIYFTPAEVERAGYPFRKSFLDKNRCAGGPNAIPFTRVGRRIYYRRDVLEQWLAGRVSTSTAS